MYKTLVVGTDGSPTADQAVQAAAELARSLGAALHIVTAFRTPRPGMGAAAGVAMVDSGAGQALAEESAKAVGEEAIEKYGDGLVAEAHGATGQRGRRDPGDGGRGGRRPDRRGQQGDAAALSRQRAELGGARCALRRAGGQDRLVRLAPCIVGTLCAKDYFAGSIAATYDADTQDVRLRPSSARRSTSWPSWPATAPRWSLASAPGALRCRSGGTWRAGAGDRPVARHGGAAAGEARGGRHRRHHRGLRLDRGGRGRSAWPTSCSTPSRT